MQSLTVITQSGTRPVWPDDAVPEAFSEAAAEYSALREAHAWLDLQAMATLEVRGPEAREFIHSLATARIPEEHGAFQSAFLTAKGKPLFLVDGMVLASDRVWLRVPQTQAETFFEHIDMYLIMRDCELRWLSDAVAGLHVSGPQSLDALLQLIPELGQSPLDPKPFASVQLSDEAEPLTVTFHPRFGELGFDILGERGRIAGFSEQLVSLNTAQLGYLAMETARVEAGFVRFGTDVKPDHMWLEAEQFQALDLHKGCYVGQESVAMAHFRGRPNKVLRGMLTDAKPSQDNQPDAEGQAAGRWTTSVWSPACQQWLTLAYLKSKLVDNQVEIAFGGQETTVSPLPVFWREGVPEPREIMQSSESHVVQPAR